jgi:glycosyltransferase involved in cell wall biosynthesis
VVLTGWLSSAAIAVLMEWSAVALAAYTAGVPQGLPNKIFEYLSAGLPILSSLRGETERLLAQHDCGLSYQAGNAEGFQAALERLKTPERRRAMGKNGLGCFEARFSTAGIYDGLVRHLEKVAASRC